MIDFLSANNISTRICVLIKRICIRDGKNMSLITLIRICGIKAFLLHVRTGLR